MEAQQMRIDAISNNLANVNTTGFKKWRPDFQDLFYQVLQAPGATSAGGAALPTGTQIGHGVRVASSFFQLQKPGGETIYTRDGAFSRDRDGNVVSADGYLLLPNITIPDDALDITVLRDGTLSVSIPGQTELSQVGQISLARFVNPEGLRALGGNSFAPSASSGDATTGTPDSTGFGSIAQGALEGSNVNVAEELVNMILAQRAFEVNSRVIQAGDEMLQTATNVTR
jgi:flagellar basal-body rod protein FlgG